MENKVRLIYKYLDSIKEFRGNIDYKITARLRKTEKIFKKEYKRKSK